MQPSPATSPSAYLLSKPPTEQYHISGSGTINAQQFYSHQIGGSILPTVTAATPSVASVTAAAAAVQSFHQSQQQQSIIPGIHLQQSHQQQHQDQQQSPLTIVTNRISSQGQQSQSHLSGAAGQSQPTVFISPLISLPGSDGYVAAPSAGFSAPQSGPPHQGPPVIRGMQSAPPPTTPQQQELSKMQQQPIYGPPGGGTTTGTVRPSQQAGLYRNTSTPAPRAPRHVMSSQLFPQPMVMSSHYYPRQPASQMFTSPYFAQTQMPPNFPYGGPYYVQNFVPQHRPSAVSGGMVPSTGATLVAGSGASQAQILSTSVLAPPSAAPGQPGTGPATGTGSNPQRKKRKFALDIIDPTTHKNILDDMEMSKNQNSTTSEVDYTEQMSLSSGNDVLGPPPQVMDSNINPDPNYNSKTSQGMVFDMVQQRKMSAIPASCQNQVNEMIAPTTPVVSAMSDGPSVEIHPKPQTKKKNRIIETTIPQQSSQMITTDKISSETNKISLTDTSGGHINVNDGSSEKCSQQQMATAASNASTLVSRTSEDNVSINKAINRGDTENNSISTSTVHHPSNVIGSSSLSSNIESRDSVLINSGGGVGVNNKSGMLTSPNNISTNNSSSSVTSTNHHHQQQQQQQQQNSSIQHSQQAQSVTSSNHQQQQQQQTQAQQHHQQQQQQPLSKREIKSFQHKSVNQQHQQQHSQQSSLPSSANNNNSSSAINNFVVNSNSNSTNNSNNSQSSNNKSFSPSLSSSSSSLTSSSYSSNISSQTITTSTNLQSMPVVVPTPPTSSTGTSVQQSSAATLSSKGVPIIDSNSAPNNNNTTSSSASTKSSHKGKDKNQQQHYHNQQQQQYQTISNINNNNNLSGIDTSSSVITSSKNLQEKQNSVNNNSQQSLATSVDSKMKLNEKEEANGAIKHKVSNDHNLKDQSAVSHLIHGSPQALDETDRVGSIDKNPSKLADEISNYCNNNDKLYSTVTDNTTNNNVTSKSKSLSPNDNESSGNRIQQQQYQQNQQQKTNVISKDSTKINSNNSENSSNNSIKGETTINKSNEMDTVGSKEKLASDGSRRDSNSSTITGGSSSNTTAVTNGTVTPVSGPKSPPPSISSNTVIGNDIEKLVPPAAVSLIHYNEGQWSPSNRDGAKVYDRNQLLNLRNSPASKAKPDLKNEVAGIVLQGNRNTQPTPSLMPPFARGGMATKGARSIGGTGNMSLGGGSMSGSSAGSIYLKQNSMSGVNMKNNSKGSKSGVIHLSLSLREDVKLNEAENAWRPTHLKQNESVPPEERAKDEVIRKVRGILNKLTPEKFETLVEQIMVLPIDTKEKVTSVMELVFEKAIDEPNFSASYAKLCSRLADNKLQSDIKCKDEKAMAQQKANNLAAFKNALLDKTEHEFTANVNNCQAKERKLEPLIKTIAECTDPEKKLELEATLEEEERKIRRRSGGTVRFIGELFKINMLTPKIIRSCIDSLLDPTSEDKLECLCKLLTTVGKKIESAPISKDGPVRSNLDEVFAKMKNIVDRKVESKISSRVRFMLQDVIDLRKSKWVSTKTDANPKTMDQIQKEVKTEQMSSQYGNFNLMTNKKDDRRYGGTGSSGNTGGSGGMSFGSSGGGSGGGGGYYKSNRQQQSGEETWYTQTSKGNRVVDTSKLGQMFNTDIDNGTKLGGMSKFQWNQTSNTGMGSTTTTSNQFAPLSSLDSTKNVGGGPRNKGSYNKGSMERDRYGSAHGSRESSSSRNASRGGAGDKDRDRDRDRDNGRGSMQRGAPPSHHSYGSSSSSATVPSRSNKSPTTMSQPLSASTLTSTASKYDMSRQPPPPAIFGKPDDDTADLIKSAVVKMMTIAFEETFEDAQEILSKYPDKYRWNYIFSILYDYLHSSKVEPIDRKLASNFVIYLLNQNLITIEHFAYAYREFSELADDMIIDVPALWQYIFQFIGPLIYKKILTIKDVWNTTLYEKDMGTKFLKEMILYFTREVGPNYTRKLWRNSNLKWTDFIQINYVDDFIKNNRFEFIESENMKPPIIGTVDLQRIKDRLKELLNESENIDDIIDYLEGNIVNIDKQFIRVLTETLCEYAIHAGKTYKLDQQKFQTICMPLLSRYIDSKEERELECLYAIQLLINKLEHPSGLLNDIFGELYDNEIIVPDSFTKWRDSKEEPTGKGVAVKGLYSFFMNLNEEETGEENN